jgi:methyl-accepting chemotaxis protein
MRVLPKLTFGIVAKFTLITAAFILGLLAISMVAMMDAKALMMKERQNKLQHLVESAHTLLSFYADQAKSGALSVQEAQKQAKNAVKALRYERDQYFWINDMKPAMVMHPIRPELDGADLSDNKDPAGKRLFVAMVDVVKQKGAGFVDYQWPKPGYDQPVEKLSYVAGFAPWGWVVGSGVYIDDVAVAVREETIRLLGAAGIVLALVLGFIVPVTLGLVRPLRAMTGAMNRLATGDIDVEVPARERRDEVGAMASALEVFKDNAGRVARLRSEQEEQERAVAEGRRADMHALADQFERSVAGVVEQVTQSARDLERTSATLKATAEDSSGRASQVAQQAQDAAANVTTVASASEELSSSIAEIAQQATRSAGMAREARESGRETEITMRELAGAAERIDNVLTLIGTIAGQTNLLALNATIEAARAGEAGRGFAVVAQEVKNLATQTAKATDEIGQQIKGVQAVTEKAVGAIGHVVGTIEHIAETASAIAAAVEEQRAVVAEISRSASEVASTSDAVSASISVVRKASHTTVEGAEQAYQAAGALGVQTGSLEQHVATFLKTVRAA